MTGEKHYYKYEPIIPDLHIFSLQIDDKPCGRRYPFYLDTLEPPKIPDMI
ncbi:MAG: hypothetical protein U9532_03575 ['Conium maculatum' witches'-broom phytoplasma]|nr:hypothetical protein ['Conium maculatum' witches'-broom phytoplasma]